MEKPKRSIGEWQKLIAEAANKKFPNNLTMSQQERLVHIDDQLDDVKASIKKEQGLLESDDHGHQDPDHRIACLIVDVLILAEMRNTNVEEELQKVLNWFESE